MMRWTVPCEIMELIWSKKLIWYTISVELINVKMWRWILIGFTKLENYLVRTQAWEYILTVLQVRLYEEQYHWEYAMWLSVKLFLKAMHVLCMSWVNETVQKLWRKYSYSLMTALLEYLDLYKTSVPGKWPS